MNVTDRHTDRQTDRQTPHDGIGRAYASIARQKWEIRNYGSELSSLLKSLIGWACQTWTSVVKLPLDATPSVMEIQRSHTTNFIKVLEGPQQPVWGPKADAQFSHLWFSTLTTDGHGLGSPMGWVGLASLGCVHPRWSRLNRCDGDCVLDWCCTSWNKTVFRACTRNRNFSTKLPTLCLGLRLTWVGWVPVQDVVWVGVAEKNDLCPCQARPCKQYVILIISSF